MKQYRISVLGNGTDWCEQSLEGLRILGAKILNGMLPCPGSTLRYKLARFHFSRRIERHIRLPGRALWYPYFCRFLCAPPDEKQLIVIYDRHILANDPGFLRYLREHYKKARLVYVFTNICSISGASGNDFIEKLKGFYDAVYAFDPADAEKYGFSYSPLLYYAPNGNTEVCEQDVFYVGRAKDRFPMLISVYEKLQALGKSTLFYIFGVPEDQQRHEQAITYNQLIPYSECLRHIKASDCLLDVIQGESEGFTIKVCEAVYYNKLLITTNAMVIDAPFYHESYIQVIRTAEDIQAGFFVNAGRVAYSEQDRAFFSAESFLMKVENDLPYLMEE